MERKELREIKEEERRRNPNPKPKRRRERERVKRERERKRKITATVVGFVVHSQLADRRNPVERLELEEKKRRKTKRLDS